MEGLEVAGWPRPRRAARPWTAARNPDGGWASRGPARQGARPGRSRCGGENPLHLIDPAEVGAADQEPRCAVTDSLPARGVDRRFSGGAQRTVGKGRTQPVSRRDRTADGGVAGRLRCLAAAEPVAAALRVRVGGWRLSAGAHGRQRRMHAGADRCHPRGQEGACRFPDRGAGERAELARALIDIKRRGLEIAPDLAVGDGALGFWKANEEVFPGTKHQRCWVHKTANVLNKVALSVQVNMKADLREIYGAPTRAAAESAIDVFAEKYSAKYEKAVACLTKDREALLAFFDFPAEDWDHLRTSNPIESVFATVRHRTVRTKGSLSATTAKLMVFKLVTAAAKTWRRLKGENQLPKVVKGVRFQNGIEVIEMPAHHAA